MYSYPTMAEVEATEAASSKITVNLSPAGNAPTLKQKRFKVDREKTVAWIVQWLQKTLKFGADESVFVYVQQAFSPSPDQELGGLHDCYGASGKLVLYYSTMPAWG